MKRIVAMVLAGGLSALTLAAAPAHAEERPYDRQQQSGQSDRRAPPRRQDGRDRRDEEAYRRDVRRPDDRDPYLRSSRHATVGIRTGSVDVWIDAGNWLARR